MKRIPNYLFLLNIQLWYLHRNRIKRNNEANACRNILNVAHYRDTWRISFLLPYSHVRGRRELE